MTSYFVKVIVFFTIVYTLLIPSTIMNAFAEGNINHGKTEQSQIDNIGTQVNESSKNFLSPNANKKDELQKIDNTPDYGKADAIGRNIQMAGQILSSSPSELAEQAKSYALGKINNTIASEAQKWLSQSSTAKINFGFDRKGRLENNSIDLLVPLYDNKADWFFFSQLGYRNKNSRNTVNLGLGGRYFNQNWMYGLNTFYDYDITGKNRRVGLGGEVWGNYIKFSANAYRRLSDWQISRNFEEHHERPANGYDINGEFFLSAYPNLGGKLSYAQYFGENVTLFNRQTKQRNPSQTKIGVIYTPIPLITMGVDYKQGTDGQSETLFLTNFNFRLGVPLSAQLSPDNVASMRTLAGSRYDLVERENNIVLDHREMPKAEFSVPSIAVGYSRELQDISKELFANTSIKQIDIEKGNIKNEFIKNGGDIYLDSGKIYIKFPEYLSDENKNNSYALYVSAELTNNQKTKPKPKQMQVIVRPFEIQKRDSANFTPPGPLLESEDKGYTFDPVIIFDTPNNTNIIKNATIDNVEWLAIPLEASESTTLDDNICNNQEIKEELKFTPNKEFKKIKIMDDGHIAENDRVTLMSKEYTGAAAVCVTMDGQSKKFVGKVTFDAKPIPKSYHIKDNKITITPDKNTLISDGEQFYTYTAQLVDEKNDPLQKQTKISDVEWSINEPVNGLNLKAPKGTVNTDENGKLQATLTSIVKVDNVMVSLAIEGHTPIKAERPVSFKLEDKLKNINITMDCKSTLLVYDKCKYTATLTNSAGNFEVGKTVEWNLKNDIPGVTLTPELDPKTKTSVTNSKGEAYAILTSSVIASGVIVTASADEKTIEEKLSVDFKWPTIDKNIIIKDKLNNTAFPGGSYELLATVYGIDNNTKYNGDIEFEWNITESNPKKDSGLSLEPPSSSKVNPAGQLSVILKSSEHKPVVKDIKVCVNIVNVPESRQCSNYIDFTDNPNNYFIKNIEVSPKRDLMADGESIYTYNAIIENNDNITIKEGIKINKIKWNAKDNKGIDITDDLITVKKSEVLDGNSNLNWEIASIKPFKDITVSLSIENQPPISAKQKVTFLEPKIRLEILSDSFVVNESYLVKAVINDENLQGQVKWDIISESETISKTSNIKHEIKITTDKKEKIKIIASIDNNGEIISSLPKTLGFEWPIIHKPTTGNVEAYPGGKYTFNATVTDNTGKINYTGHGNTFNWYVKTPTDWKEKGLSLLPSESDVVSVDNQGELAAVLRSSLDNSAVTGITVCIRVKNKDIIVPETEVCSNPVNFIEDKSKYSVKDINIIPNPKISPNKTLIADGDQAYIYEAIIINNEGNPVTHEKISRAKWSIDNPIDGVTLHVPEGELQTDSEGKLKATLTSIKKVEDIVVSLTIEKQPPKLALKVSFTWPIIGIPTFKPNSGDVINDGKDYYTYTAKVYESDGITPYIGQKIKFKWNLQKPVGDNTTYLKNEGESSLSPEGELTNYLVSSDNPPVKNAIVCVAITNNNVSEDEKKCANEISFSNYYTLDLTVNRSTPTVEGIENKYIFTAEVRSKKDNSLQPNIPVTWRTSLSVKDPNLKIQQEDKTNSQGKATFTMYSIEGGFKDITVTAKTNNSYPDLKSETVEILAKPKDANNIMLLTYNKSGGKYRIATGPTGITASDLNFGWEKLKFSPYIDPNGSEISGSNGRRYSSDNMNIVEAIEQHFLLKRAGSTKVKIHYTFPSGRYIVYQTKININVMVFSDANASWFSGNTQIKPPFKCATGTAVKTTDIGTNITNIVNQGADLKAAGLTAAVESNVGYAGLNTPEYTQLYTLASSNQESALFSLLCSK
ncbi:inverse autotransporter beta domain-containing protein [Xenorhabdus littoralis]|uniref:inverse autotransporter beta domain-containing protein n=1 Tax=Xenorhabdus littoralis TaxID=2582835 RepID=UPI0029E7FB82|nr:inverse autotransporter beta domain-containing protein [Xenorhabdus sp. psl]MDX7991700.1 hypothetical protein [Xenorhabdus sp. psl]